MEIKNYQEGKCKRREFSENYMIFFPSLNVIVILGKRRVKGTVKNLLLMKDLNFLIFKVL
jgi:hypothetical protein